MKKLIKVSIILGCADCDCQQCSEASYWICPVCETGNHIDKPFFTKVRFYKPERVRCKNCSNKFGVKSIRDRNIERIREEEQV